MKKLFLYLMAIPFLVLACSKDPEPEPVDPAPTPSAPTAPTPTAESWAIVYDYVSSTRSTCANYASLLKTEVDKGKCIGLAIKCYGDPLVVTMNYNLFNSFNSDRPCASEVPSYAVGDASQVAYSSIASLCSNLKNRDCEIGVSAISSISNNKMTVSVKTKNFKVLDSVDYHIAVYVMEDKVTYPQTGVTGVYQHDYVLRTSNTSVAYKYYGVLENISKTLNYVYSKDYVIDLTPLLATTNDQVPYKPENTYAAVVVYKKGLSTDPVAYKYVNATWTRK